MVVVALSCVHSVVGAVVGANGCGWAELTKDAVDQPLLDGTAWYQLTIFF